MCRTIGMFRLLTGRLWSRWISSPVVSPARMSVLPGSAEDSSRGRGLDCGPSSLERYLYSSLSLLLSRM